MVNLEMSEGKIIGRIYLRKNLGLCFLYSNTLLLVNKGDKYAHEFIMSILPLNA